MTVLEIGVQDSAGARTALQGGADRIELATGLTLGGLTPSLGLVEAALELVSHTKVGVHVLVRPRSGNFLHDPDDARVAERDISRLVALGVEGVVVGPVTADGGVDREVLARLVAAAAGRQVTYHRAMDLLVDRHTALEHLISAQVTRVLTSGGAKRAIEGTNIIASLVSQAHGEIEIMAGGGISPADIPALQALGIAAIHMSASVPQLHAGGPGGGGDCHYGVTNLKLVQAARFALPS